MTNAGSKSTTSASSHTTISPDTTARLFHIASPLPYPGPTAGSTSSSCTTRAPSPAAIRAVASELWLSTTTISLTRGTSRTSRSRRVATMAPTVSSTFSAGRHTETLSPCSRARAARPSGSKSPPR